MILFPDRNHFFFKFCRNFVQKSTKQCWHSYIFKFKPSGFESESTKTEMIIGNLDEDDLETFCKPDNMTVRVRKAFIDAYEEKYGALFLEDPGCNRFENGDYYSWEIAPDLLGCGTSIELTDTHVTFVNSLSTLYSEENQIKPVNGIIFGNQAP